MKRRSAYEEALDRIAKREETLAREKSQQSGGDGNGNDNGWHFDPIEIPGEPLSETIIRERRR